MNFAILLKIVISSLSRTIARKPEFVGLFATKMPHERQECGNIHNAWHFGMIPCQAEILSGNYGAAYGLHRTGNSLRL